MVRVWEAVALMWPTAPHRSVVLIPWSPNVQRFLVRKLVCSFTSVKAFMFYRARQTVVTATCNA